MRKGSNRVIIQSSRARLQRHNSMNKPKQASYLEKKHNSTIQTAISFSLISGNPLLHRSPFHSSVLHRSVFGMKWSSQGTQKDRINFLILFSYSYLPTLVMSRIFIRNHDNSGDKEIFRLAVNGKCIY